MTERKNISITKPTRKQLEKIERTNGASHSASIRIAVDAYYSKLMKKEEG